MNIICHQKELSQAIGVVQKAVSSKTTMPILKGILVETANNKLKLTGNDLELGIETIIDSQVIRDGAVVIDSRLFGEIVRKLPDSYIEIDCDEKSNVVIKCEHSEFKIMGYSQTEYPQLPDVDDNFNYEINANCLKNMIRQTVFAISQDETKPLLMGELIEIDGADISVVALDGYRLAIKKAGIENNIGNINVIVPGKTLSEINRIVSGEEKNIKMAFTQKHALFSIENIRIITRLLEGEFINYKQIIPKESRIKVTVNTKNLQNSIERASLLAREGKNNLIKFSITDGLMIITSNSEVGNVYEELPINLEGGNIEIAFNSRYMLEALKVMECDSIVMNFDTNLSPCTINPQEDAGYTYMILPVRISAGN